MKRIILLLLMASFLVFLACELKTPATPKYNFTRTQLALKQIVAVGNSLTAGFQSSGLVEEFQLHSYPYLLAKQLGKEYFEQPLIAAPGIGSPAGKTPMRFENGQIIQDNLTVDPATLLKNALLPRPYDNLGVPGADLNDVLNTIDGSGGNAFFDIVLRNPNFANMTMLQQAIALNPTMVLLWVGNNDVLGAALDGGDLTQITPAADFQSRLTQIVTELASKTDAVIIMANIPYVTDIPYVNTLDMVFHNSPALGITSEVPVVFDAQLQPVLFDTSMGGLYIPLLTQETNVTHVLLPALIGYQEQGLGIPDSAALVAMGLPPVQAQALVQGMIAAGLTPSGIPIPGNMTLTADEETTIRNAIDGFNQIIAGIAGNQIPVVDANSMLGLLNSQGIDGYSGKFVLLDPANTAFSLDGVHPNNGGYAIVANAFLQIIKAVLQLNVPDIDTQQYKGQYVSGGKVAKIDPRAIESVKYLFVRPN